MEQNNASNYTKRDIPTTHTNSASKALSHTHTHRHRHTHTHTVFLEWKLYHSCFYVPVEVWTYGCQLMHSLRPEGKKPSLRGWGGSSAQTWVTLNPQVTAFISPRVPIMILHTPILWGNYTRYMRMVVCQDRAPIANYLYCTKMC